MSDNYVNFTLEMPAEKEKDSKKSDKREEASDESRNSSKTSGTKSSSSSSTTTSSRSTRSKMADPTPSATITNASQAQPAGLNNEILSVLMSIKEAVTATPWSADNSYDRDNAEQHVSLYDYEFDGPELVNVDAPSEITDFDNFINSAMPTDAVASGSGSDNILSNSGEEENLFSSVMQEFSVDEHVGHKVNAAVAESVNTMFMKKLNEESLSSKAKSIHRPENCQKLIVPRVNPLIWDKLKAETKSSDLKMQRAQNMLMKGTITVIEVIDSLMSNGDPLGKQLAKKLMGSLAFQSNVMYEMNMKRRELIKPDLNVQFKHLCSSHVPITEELFGDDLHKHVKDITESQKVSNRLQRGRAFRGYHGQRGPAGRSWRGANSYRGRYHPYHANQNFLGQRGSREKTGPTKTNAKEKTSNW